ncbi:glycosyltransferase family 4 protein [Polynucleobacter paneuropaeus]|nr:glycosyltransferase family 4 protein [Polynucleobacter paneuropaeus]
MKKKTVFITSHITDLSGPTEALVKYLNNNFSDVYGVLHPLPYCENKNVEVINRGIVKKIKFKLKGFDLIYYFKDVLFNFYYFLKLNKKFDYYIGVDPLNCIVGVALKKMGLVSNLIYYTIDWVPVRFQNKIINYIYHKIDKICVNNGDKLWVLSNKIFEIRENQGGKNIVLTPVGCFIAEIPVIKKLNPKNNFNIVLLGALAPSKGVDLILNEWGRIIKKIPCAKLYVIGKTSLENVENGVVYEPYEPKFENNKDSIFYLGVLSHDKLVDKLLDMDVGLALYKPDKNNFTAWADPSRVKDYLSCGLPVVITSVPEISADIKKNNCGKVINYSGDELIESLFIMYKNSDELTNMGINARNYMEKYDWNNIFNHSFEC